MIIMVINYMKKIFKVFSERNSDKEKKEFQIYTSENAKQRVAESVARNVFYCDNITIININ